MRSRPPELIENVLKNFLGRLRIAENPVEDGRKEPGIAVIERLQRCFVPLNHSLHKGRVRGPQLRLRTHCFQLLPLNTRQQSCPDWYSLEVFCADYHKAYAA